MLWVGIIICALLIVIVFLAKPIEDDCNLIPKEVKREFEQRIKDNLQGKEDGSYTFELDYEGEHDDIILTCWIQQKDLFENDESVISYWFQLRYGGGYEMVVNWMPQNEKQNNG